MKLVPALVAGVSLLIPAAAQADSTVADPGGSEFTLTDDTNSSNTYVLNNSKASGRWVIYDKTGGKVRIAGGSNPCTDTSFTVKSDTHAGDDTFLGVSCPPRAKLRVNMNGSDESDEDNPDDEVTPALVGGTYSDAFSGSLIVDGGTGKDIIHGTNATDQLSGGDGEDRFIPGRGSDVIDGGDGYDTDDNRDRSEPLTISQDNVADDGITGSGEHANVKSNVEALIGGTGNDVLYGSDTGGADGGSALIGWSGNDLIVPGLRAEALVPDGIGQATPNDIDTVSYLGRDEPVQVSLDGQANDGTLDASGNVVEDDNVIDGFESIVLTKGDDRYFGPHAGSIPHTDLAAYQTAAQRVFVFAGGGNDKSYPGSNAEDISGQGGTADMVSYLFRQPTNHLTRVSMTLDNVANDGEVFDRAGGAEALLTVGLLIVSPVNGSKIELVEETAGRFIVTHSYPVSGQKFKVVIDKTYPIYSYDFGTGPYYAHVGSDAIEALREYALEYLAKQPSIPARNLLTRINNEIRPGWIAEWTERLKRTLKSYFGWLPAFDTPDGPGGGDNEGDNVRDDNEVLQGSTNTGFRAINLLTSVPTDYIEGNGAGNVVLGSPGPDYVVGAGGPDTLWGDQPGGEASNDWLLGGSGTDLLIGGAGSDYLAGGPDPDRMYTADLDTIDDGAADLVYCGRNDWPVRSLLPYFDNILDAPDGDTLHYSVADDDFVPDACKTGGTASNKTVATATATASQVTYTAKPGFANKVKVVKVGSNFEIKDTKGKVEPGVGCKAKTGMPKVALCPVKTKISADLGDGKDVFRTSSLDSTIATTVKGGDAKDKLITGAGNDTLQGGPGPDTMNGGAGSDTISYAEKTVPVDVYLAQPSTSHNGETSFTLNTFTTHGAADLEGDVISWAESVIGGSGADILQGNQLDNTIDGGAGADAFSGGPGSDTIKAKDGTKDGSILCGDGIDRYQVDASDPITANSSCEDLQ